MRVRGGEWVCVHVIPTLAFLLLLSLEPLSSVFVGFWVFAFDHFQIARGHKMSVFAADVIAEMKEMKKIQIFQSLQVLLVPTLRFKKKREKRFLCTSKVPELLHPLPFLLLPLLSLSLSVALSPCGVWHS